MHQTNNNACTNNNYKYTQIQAQTSTEASKLQEKGSEAKSEEYDVPGVDASFLRCTATAILYLIDGMQKEVPAVPAMRRPRSPMKQCASGPNTSSVSTAKGSKQ